MLSASHTTTHTTTEAEKFVRTSAAEIGFHGEALNDLCANMSKEFVFHVDQFEHITSSQWRCLGAPIGLVATMKQQHRLLSSSSSRNNNNDDHHHNVYNSSNDPKLSSPLRDDDNDASLINDAEQGVAGRKQQQQQFDKENNNNNSKDAAIPSSSSSSSSTTDSTPPPIPPTGASADDGFFSASSFTTKSGKPEQQPKKWHHIDSEEKTKSCCGLLDDLSFLRFKSLFKVFKFADLFVPFDHQKGFKLAMLNTMSNHDLKQTLLSTSELWFIFDTIFLGSCIELWGGFPEFQPEDGYGTYCLVYNLLIYFTTITCAFGVAVFSALFVVTSTIHKSNMKRYLVLVMPALQFGEFVLFAGWYGLVAIGIMYFHARNAATILQNDLDCHFNNYFLTALALLIFAGLYSFANYSINMLSRLPFHCGLWAENIDDEEHDIILGEGTHQLSTAELEREEVRRTLLSKIIPSPNKMNESYRLKNFYKYESTKTIPCHSNSTTRDPNTNKKTNTRKNVIMGGIGHPK